MWTPPPATQNTKLIFQSELYCDSAKKQQAFESFVDLGTSTGDAVFEIIRNPSKLNSSVAGYNNEGANCVNRISDEEEKLRESEIQPKINSDASSNPRRNRKMKDRSYYPSSSLFVSRQFFSR